MKFIITLPLASTVCLNASLKGNGDFAMISLCNIFLLLCSFSALSAAAPAPDNTGFDVDSFDRGIFFASALYNEEEREFCYQAIGVSDTLRRNAENTTNQRIIYPLASSIVEQAYATKTICRPTKIKLSSGELLATLSKDISFPEELSGQDLIASLYGLLPLLISHCFDECNDIPELSEMRGESRMMLCMHGILKAMKTLRQRIC